MHPFGIQVTFISEFGSSKTSKVSFTAFNTNARDKFFIGFIVFNAKIASRIIFSGFSLILHICRFTNITKIIKRIVCSVAINVIYIIDRPFACHIKPSKAVGFIPFRFNSYTTVTKFINITSNISNLCTSCAFCAGNFPRKYSSFRIVMKKFFKTCLSKHLINSSQVSVVGCVAILTEGTFGYKPSHHVILS